MTKTLSIAAVLFVATGTVRSLPAQTDSAASATTLSPTAWRSRNIDARLFLPVAPHRAALTAPSLQERMTRLPRKATSHRARNATVGGFVGAVVGVGVCTGISNLMDDAAKPRVSTCTLTGNVLFGVGGLAVGALIGAAIK